MYESVELQTDAELEDLLYRDPSVIEPGIRSLNLGPVKVMSVDDVFGPKP